MKKLFLLTVAIGTLIVGLCACSHHTNPLAQPDRTDSAKFLVRASHYAEKRLHLKNENAYGYRDCMLGRLKKSICHQLYTEMVHYSKTQKDYDTLKLSDLKDRTIWQSLKVDYQGAAFSFME